jgi:hypothetical protein
MRSSCSVLLVATVLAVIAACGPATRGSDHVTADASGEADAPPGVCVPEAEICGDGIDNDCDMKLDCADVDCSGINFCPICGTVAAPEQQPLPLPDGIGMSTACTTNAQCNDPLLPNCVHNECHASYTSTLDFIGFPQGAVLTEPNKLLAVCVKMEHSWLRDLHMDLITPGGHVIALHSFVGRTGDEIYLGEANDSDQAGNPIPGTGYEYCWKSTGAAVMLQSPTTTIGGKKVLPAGDYASVTPWAMMQGTPLNGPWTMRVTDLWPADNGFMFEWSIKFDPSLVADCSGPIVQ